MYVRNEDDASSVNGNKYVDTVFDTVNEEKAVAFKAMNINDIKQVPCADLRTRHLLYLLINN